MTPWGAVPAGSDEAGAAPVLCALGCAVPLLFYGFS